MCFISDNVIRMNEDKGIAYIKLAIVLCVKRLEKIAQYISSFLGYPYTYFLIYKTFLEIGIEYIIFGSD